MSARSGGFTDGFYIYRTSDWQLEQFLSLPPGVYAENIGEAGEGVFSSDGTHVVALHRRSDEGTNDHTPVVLVYELASGEIIASEEVGPSEFYPQLPEGNIERIPGSDDYVWYANNRAGVVRADMGTQVVENEETPEAGLALSARPNPASSSVTASYTLSASGDVRLTAHDLLGREVAVLASGAQAAGAHRATLDVSSLPSGTYVLRLVTPEATEVQRVTIVR